MKKDLHPKWYPEAKVICSGKTVLTVGSTQPEIQVEVWSGTHPFYTGKQHLVDIAGRVEKYQQKLDKQQALLKKKKSEAKATTTKTEATPPAKNTSKSKATTTPTKEAAPAETNPSDKQATNQPEEHLAADTQTTTKNEAKNEAQPAPNDDQKDQPVVSSETTG